MPIRHVDSQTRERATRHVVGKICLIPERSRHAVQGRLRDLLVEKSREQKVALEAVGRFRDTARVRAKKSDEAMYQVRQIQGTIRMLNVSASSLFSLVALRSTPHKFP